RPCVIVSPDELNAHLLTVIVAPLSSAGKPYPFRIRCRFQNRDGLVVLDQIRTVDRQRLLRRLGRLSPSSLRNVLDTLREMFEG
ncbi:MAG TPA: type II toxin-antitoxin system PemK/MazF family toxin, partial [Polyangiaceae bacterium]